MIGICNGGVSVLRATTSVRTCASTPQRHRGQPARLATTSRSTCALCVQTTTSSRRRVGAGRCGQPRSGGSSRLRRRSAGEGTGQVRRGRRQRHRHRRFAGRHQLRPRRRPRDLRRPSTGFANNDLVRADEPLCFFFFCGVDVDDERPRCACDVLSATPSPRTTVRLATTPRSTSALCVIATTSSRRPRPSSPTTTSYALTSRCVYLRRRRRRPNDLAVRVTCCLRHCRRVRPCVWRRRPVLRALCA